jgi:hypothetical protein
MPVEPKTPQRFWLPFVLAKTSERENGEED